VYDEGSFEGVRIRRVRCGEEGWERACLMNARPLAPRSEVRDVLGQDWNCESVGVVLKTYLWHRGRGCFV
jgi:hypothetical protein